VTWVVPARQAALSETLLIDEVLAGQHGVEPIRRLLLRPADLAPGELLRGCLPAAQELRWRLLRSKLKPGRKLSAWYELVAPRAARSRRIAVTWQAGPAPAPPEGTLRSLDAEARDRGLAAPFARLWAGSADRQVHLLLAPLDPAFPHLVRFYDPAFVASLLGGVLGGAVATRSFEVRPVRYRPGQRHVLRYTAMAGPGVAVFAKIYRDGAATRLHGFARRLAGPVASASPAQIAMPLPAAPDHRAVLWLQAAGRPLWQALRDDPGSFPMAAVAGAVLRAIHDIDVGPVAAERGVADEVAAAARACAHITGLLPALGGRLRRMLDSTGERIQGLPVEAPALTHGDAKCDNLLVGRDRLTVIDLDRCGYADPALDLGKLLADLRWWSGRIGLDPGTVQALFLTGYGDCDRGRLARARAYEVLFEVKVAARRLGVHDPAWAHQVREALGRAESRLARLPCP
jgi:aminoglycoside phosphotransferase (APT) family kinase protein